MKNAKLFYFIIGALLMLAYPAYADIPRNMTIVNEQFDSTSCDTWLLSSGCTYNNGASGKLECGNTEGYSALFTNRTLNSSRDNNWTIIFNASITSISDTSQFGGLWNINTSASQSPTRGSVFWRYVNTANKVHITT